MIEDRGVVEVALYELIRSLPFGRLFYFRAGENY